MIHPMKHAIAYWLCMAVLVLLGAVLLVINIWLFWPYQTLDIIGYSDGAPLPVVNSVVHPGEAIKYELNYCKYTDKPSVVRRTMIDGQVITLVDSPGRLPTGCHKATVKTAIVPETINPGNYYLDVSVDYKVNPIRTQTIHYRTQYFQVTDLSGNLPIPVHTDATL
jgi:hypothetical protein